jgi:hypothetical protein
MQRSLGIVPKKSGDEEEIARYVLKMLMLSKIPGIYTC